MWLARDVTIGGWLTEMLPCISSLSDSSHGCNGTVTTEAPQRCLHHSDRSRVCDCSGSLARDLQNHRNPALTTGWYASHPKFFRPQFTLSGFTVKAGYPPKGLTLIPELPISSLGLSKGEQLIVNQNGRGQGTNSAAPRSATGVPSTGVAQQPSTRRPALTQPTTNEPDSVETEGGYLVHRVRFCPTPRSRFAEGNG